MGAENCLSWSPYPITLDLRVVSNLLISSMMLKILSLLVALLLNPIMSQADDMPMSRQQLVAEVTNSQKVVDYLHKEEILGEYEGAFFYDYVPSTKYWEVHILYYNPGDDFITELKVSGTFPIDESTLIFKHGLSGHTPNRVEGALKRMKDHRQSKGNPITSLLGG